MQPTLPGLHLVEGAASWLGSFLLCVPVVRSGTRGVYPSPEYLISHSAVPWLVPCLAGLGSGDPRRVQVLSCHPLPELPSSLAWSLTRASNP